LENSSEQVNFLPRQIAKQNVAIIFYNRKVRISVIWHHDTEFTANGSFVEIQ
jgi:hypothetical protein